MANANLAATTLIELEALVPKGGKKTIGNNTVASHIETENGGRIEIRLHGHRIVVFSMVRGSAPILSLYSAGYPTRTTVHRLHTFLSANVPGAGVRLSRGRVILTDTNEEMPEGVVFEIPSPYKSGR